MGPGTIGPGFVARAPGAVASNAPNAATVIAAKRFNSSSLAADPTANVRASGHSHNHIATYKVFYRKSMQIFELTLER